MIAQRLKNAREEIGHWEEYHYLVVNRDLEESVEAVRSILHAERRRPERQADLRQLAQRLIEEL